MSPLPTAELKSLLLQLLFGQELPSRDLRELTEQDWAAIRAMLQEHRLAPLLHWRLSREFPDLPVPETLRTHCAHSFKAATLRSLMLQRELLRVHAVLASAGIAYAALKGAWLAFHAYPHPALRPLRDLDVLVPEAEVLRAFQLLLDSGYSRIERYPGDPEALLKHGNHLPPLRAPSGQVNVELHFGLYKPKSRGDFELSAAPGFWPRCPTDRVADADIVFLPPTEQLLHLIIHAVYDHQLNNGPLLLSDMAYLLQTRSVDWPRFWDLAGRGGHTRGAVLALRLLERYREHLAIRWPAGIQDEAADIEPRLDAAAQLALRDFEASADVNLEHEMASERSLRRRAGVFLRKAFPPKSNIAAIYPVAQDSPWVYAWYPVKWWRLACMRLPEYLQTRRQGRAQAEVSQLRLLDEWLREGLAR